VPRFGVRRRHTMEPRPIYIVRLRPLPGIDAVRALRAALKVLLRRFGLKAIEVKEEP
jgi:hypothetical protein